jgi:hypothetical protein
MLLDWFNNLMSRWTQSQYDRLFDGIDPSTIKDIDKFLKGRGYL